MTIEEKIKEAIADNSKWKSVLKELMGTDVLVIARPGAENGQTDENGKKMLNLLTFTDPKAGTIIPFFTSPQRVSVLVNKEHTQFNCIKLKTVNLFNAIKGKAAVMNPNSDCGKLFNPFEMNILVMENKDKLSHQPQA